MRRLTAVGVGIMVAVAAAGCVGERPTLGERELAPSTEAPDGSDAADDPDIAVIARAAGDSLAVYADADDDDPSATVTPATTPPPAPDEPGTPAPVVVLVLTDPAGSDRDRIPVRLPDNSTGWVERDDVELSQTTLAVEIDLGGHELVVHDDGDRVFDAPVALGPDRPAPGPYYITGLVQPAQPGPYGSYAYAISGGPPASAAVLAGAGLVGVHGTTDPGAIGGDAPSGSVGLADETIVTLATEVRLPLGTPVTVR